MVYEETRPPPGFIYGTGRTCYRNTLAHLRGTDHDVGVNENNRRPHETINYQSCGDARRPWCMVPVLVPVIPSTLIIGPIQ